MVGTESKVTSKDADIAWDKGEVFRIGIDFKTDSERTPSKKWWEFWK